MYIPVLLSAANLLLSTVAISDLTTVLPNSPEVSSKSKETTMAFTAEFKTKEDMNLKTNETGTERLRRDQHTSRSLQSHIAEQLFQRTSRIAEQHIRFFIARYKTVWTMPVPIHSMPLNVALLHLPSVKGYLQQNQSLSKAQRLCIIRKLLRQMKSPRVLPNTVQMERRLEEMNSKFGVLSYLNKLEGMTDTMLRLLLNSGSLDVSHLNTSDISTALTVLAAAHVIEDQLNHL